jgi:enoyl-CoA hydratase
VAELVSYQLHDSIAVVTLDDGKVNVLSRQMLRDIDGALDRAVADGATVVLTGRPGVFSAGLDLHGRRGGARLVAGRL